MDVILLPRLIACGALLLVAPIAAAQVPNSCSGQAACSETSSFVATVTDFRTSTVSYYKVVTATVRIRNKLNRPLILGYVSGSGISTDDQGHRFVVGDVNGVRGIGWISAKTFDAKFTLQPAESGDARIEMSWRPASRADIYGTSWVMEFSLREIDPLPGNQFRLGKEHALQFRGFRDGWMAMTGGAGVAPAQAPVDAAPAPTPPPTAVPAPTPDAAPDPCTGNSRCYDAGPFIAEVRSLTPGAAGGRHHVVDIVLRISNLSPAPIILGYKSTSSGMIDNLGNRYVFGRPGTHDVSFKGIGLVAGNAADPQFALQPGQSRDAAFTVIRFNSGASQLGTAWNYDVTLSQLEILPSRQIREVRDHIVNFRDLTSKPSAAATLKSAKELMDAIRQKLQKKPR